MNFYSEMSAPPRLTPLFSHVQEQRRLASSRLLRDLHAEISDRPEEIQEADADGSRYLRSGTCRAEQRRCRTPCFLLTVGVLFFPPPSAKVADQESEERVRYEEENYKRLPTVKTKKRRTTRNVVDDVLDFSGFERKTGVAAVGFVPHAHLFLLPHHRLG